MEERTVDQLLKARAEIEEQLRRQKTALTILFTDVVGSTSYFDLYGDTAGLAMIEHQTSMATQVFQQFQGRVIKTIGDSVMAEFPAPVLAVRGAIELQRRVLADNQRLPERNRTQVRIGINTGMGFRRQNDVFGHVVNLAARVTKHTGPAQVLISSSVHLAISDQADLRSRSLGFAEIHGKHDKEELIEVIWTDTGAYDSLRQNATAAVARGELVASGSRLDKFLGSTEDTPVAALPAGSGLEAIAARYEILEEAGRGGMGIVYKSRDRETGEIVALKVLKPEIAADQVSMQRFKNELRIARRITHRNVCRIHEFNRSEGVAYISMEFVEGQTLRSMLTQSGWLPLDETMGIARQICEGLREAHGQGVVHRDMKPENVMIGTDGNVKLMDFGIARATEAQTGTTASIVGTPAYMAPEQAEGKVVDARADIYALGLILYEMTTGIPPFQGDSAISVILKQLRDIPKPPTDIIPELPVHLERAILKCLEKRPEDRYPSIKHLEAAISMPADVQAAITTPKTKAGLVAGAVALVGIATILGVVALRRGVQTPTVTQTPAPVKERTEPARSESPPAQPTVAEQTQVIPKPAPKPASAKSVPVDIEFEFRQGTITIEHLGKKLFQQNLEGKKAGRFLGLKERFVGKVVGSFTLPADARELQVIVSTPAADYKKKVAVPPGTPGTLVIRASRNASAMAIQWTPRSNKLDSRPKVK
jgi:class 3 adenylate cyclase/tRNA A-37 threonylcarbamoyl transferase component Bud32